MTKGQFQRAHSRQPRSRWTRAVGIVCLLWILIASSAQAVHVHGGLRCDAPARFTAAHGPQIPAEECCPLCIAMHSAFPAAVQSHSGLLLLLGERHRSSITSRAPDQLWHFAGFSRPPPLPPRA